MTKSDVFLVTCEHGGNRIPSRYQEFFRDSGALLRSHRGYDPGALRIARELSDALAAPLIVSTVSRLMIDLNRSPGHPRLYSEVSRRADAEIRAEMFNRYYRPYRTKVETTVAQAIAGGERMIHISCHSFAPECDGKPRNADIGLLYDPARSPEVELCRHWRTALAHVAPELKARMNYPHTGTADGLTVHLRRRFPVERYLGIDLEINQKHVFERGQHWHDLRCAVIRTLLEVAPRLSNHDCHRATDRHDAH